MEQMIGKYTYWGGVVLAVLAFLLRAAHAMGIYVGETVGRSIGVSPSNLAEGAVLLLAVSIATGQYAAHIKKA